MWERESWREREREGGSRAGRTRQRRQECFQHSCWWTATQRHASVDPLPPLTRNSSSRPQLPNTPPPHPIAPAPVPRASLWIALSGRQHGVQHAEQRRSGSGQATQTPVAPAQDAHPHQAALQLGHWALPVPQQDAGEAATRPEEDPHVLALLGQTVIFSVLPVLISSRLPKVPHCVEHLGSSFGMNVKNPAKFITDFTNSPLSQINCRIDYELLMMLMRCE